jgi:hypothetical protein
MTLSRVAAHEAGRNMSERDIFKEVEEDLRREQLAKLWDRYGVYVLAVATMVILFVGAFNGWRWYEAKRASENGTAYFEATTLAGEQKYAEARDALAKLGQDAPAGYRTLAKLETAALHAKEGRKAEAVAVYDQVAADSSTDGVLKDFARIQGAALRLDEAEPAEIARRLDKLDADGNPWRYSARELLALSAYRSGNTAESEKLFTRILSDPFAPAEMRKRAESMLALLVKTSMTGSAQMGSQNGSGAPAPQKDAATQ